MFLPAAAGQLRQSGGGGRENKNPHEIGAIDQGQDPRRSYDLCAAHFGLPAGGGSLVIKGTLPPDGIFFNKDRDAMNQTTKNGALYLCILINLL